MARLFVAVWPSPDALGHLEELSRREQPGVRWVPPHQWHVTLRFLGESDADEVRSALAGAVLPATVARLGGTVRRLGKEAIVVPVDGLQHVAAAVREATADVGRPPDARPFSGHLTLGRLRRGATCDLLGAPIAAAFPVTEVTLVRSTLGRRGAVYDIVDRWPTATAAPTERRRGRLRDSGASWDRSSASMG